MRVYAVEAYGNYGGGMAIVAANNEGEAKKIAETADQGFGMWAVRYGKPEKVYCLPGVQSDSEAKVLCNYETGE